jgi:hypothetical protein
MGSGSDIKKTDYSRIADDRYTVAGKRPEKLMPREAIN